MKKFNLGRTVGTSGAVEALSYGFDALPLKDPSMELNRRMEINRRVAALLGRHESGDWGEVCDEDKATNEEALKEGLRLMSVYTLNGTKFWVITEADRSVTTILLPEEY